jgi:hypothetical protein
MTFPLLIHIASGTSGILSGFAASFLRKGSRRHGLAGNVFVVSMLLLSSTGTYMAMMKHEPGNVMGGFLTFYMVTTAWASARREGAGTSVLDWGGLLVVLTLAVFELTYGTQAALSPTGMKAGYPPGPYFMLGTVAVLATVGDIRMLLRRGISGTQRVARHLWRMCFAFFVASSSLFLARQQYFPDLMRRTGTLYLLSFLPLLLMIFWLIRVRFAKAYGTRTRRPIAIGGPQPSLSTR